MASNAGYETVTHGVHVRLLPLAASSIQGETLQLTPQNGDIESPNTAGPNEAYDNHSAQHARNQTKEVLELNYRNSKHSAICSIVVFLSLVLLLGVILFVLIFFLDGPGSTQPEIEMQVEVKGQYVVAVSITIQNLDFREGLLDQNSKEYADLEDQVISAVSSAIAETELKDKYADLEINNVRSGSVIVDFFVVFCDPLMTESDIIQTVQDALGTINSNNATKRNLEIDNSQLSVEAASEDDLDKLRGTFCEPSVPTISPTGTPPVTPTATVSSSVSPTLTSSQLTPTLSSDVITPTPSSQMVTPVATPTPSSSFVTTEVPGTSTSLSLSTTVVPGTSTSVSLSTTKVSSMTLLMSSTLIKTSGFTTTQSPTTTLPSVSTQIVTTPLTTSFITATTSSERLSPTITPSLPTSIRISSTPSIDLTSTSSIIFSTTMPAFVSPTASASHDVSMTSSLPISSQPPTSMPSQSSIPIATSAIKPTTTISPTPTMTSLPITPVQSSSPAPSPSVTVTSMSSMSVQNLSMTPGPTPSQTPSSMSSASVSQASPSVTRSSIPSASSTLISPTPTVMTSQIPTATTMVIQPTSSSVLSSSVVIPSLTPSSIPSSLSSSPSQTSTSVASMTTTPSVPSFSSSIVTPSPTSSPLATSRSTLFSQGTVIPSHTSTSVVVSPTPLPSTTIQPMVTTMTAITPGTTVVTSSPPTSPPINTTSTSSTPTEPSSLSPSITAYQSSEQPKTSPVQSTATVPIMTSSKVPTTQTPSTSPSVKTTAGVSTEEVSTQVAPPATAPLTVCSESSRFFNPSTFLNSTDVLDGTPVNFQCSWNYFVAIQDVRIRVQFLSFDIGNDVLEIDVSDSRTVTYTGSNIPPELTTDAHMVRFTLKTDLQTNPIEFSIFLQMILPENRVTAPMLNSSTAVAGPTTLPGCSSSAQLIGPGPPITITSPGYPRGYLTDLICTWQFIATGVNEEGILLEFVGFDLGDDILEVSSSDVNFVSRQLTGSQLPAPISTSAVHLQLRFISDGANTATGFELTIQIIETNAPCVPSHMFVNSAQSRVVTSPGYPINYGPNLVCSWTLQSTQPNSPIIITFLNFDLGDDLLQVVYQGNILQFSGSSLPMPITVSSDRVELQFTSNSDNQNLGFRLEVSVQAPIITTPGTTLVMTSDPQQSILSTAPDLSCIQSSVLLTAASDPKTFTSPGYPTHNYGPESSCLWSFIVVDNTKVLRLQFVSFDIGNDVVSVDYGASTSKMLTGSNLPDEITTFGTTLSVELTTSPQSSYPGFEAVITVVDR